MCRVLSDFGAAEISSKSCLKSEKNAYFYRLGISQEALQAINRLNWRATKGNFMQRAQYGQYSESIIRHWYSSINNMDLWATLGYVTNQQITQLAKRRVEALA